jgi:hypothetical protein
MKTDVYWVSQSASQLANMIAWIVESSQQYCHPHIDWRHLRAFNSFKYLLLAFWLIGFIGIRIYCCWYKPVVYKPHPAFTFPSAAYALLGIVVSLTRSPLAWRKASNPNWMNVHGSDRVWPNSNGRRKIKVGHYVHVSFWLKNIHEKASFFSTFVRDRRHNLFLFFPSFRNWNRTPTLLPLSCYQTPHPVRHSRSSIRVFMGWT